jgi:hypothetical protein
MVTYDIGGLYCDIDYLLEQYDIKIQQIFDFFAYKLELYHVDIQFNFAIIAKPHHPIMKQFLQEFTTSYTKMT